MSLADSQGKSVWQVYINGINNKRKSRTISLLLLSALSRRFNTLLSIRLLPNQQQSATWHNVLFSLHSVGKITPYFDGFAGEDQWVPVINNEAHSITLGDHQNNNEFTIHYKDPFLYTRSLSEPEVVALQQKVTLTDGTTMYPHCLCPEGYIPFLNDQYLCVSNDDDQHASYISRYIYIYLVIIGGKYYLKMINIKLIMYTYVCTRDEMIYRHNYRDTLRQ